MKLVYARAGGASATGLAGDFDGGGGLGGAGARGLPHRRAWVAHAARPGNDGADIWKAMSFTAPQPQRRPVRPRDGEQAYILQQDPDGLWFVDPWGTSVGTMRPPGSAGSRIAPPGPSRDLGNTCFIIELAHATRR